MTVHWSTRAKLSPLFRHRFLPLSIYPSIPLLLFSSRCCLSLSRNWLLLSFFFTFLFHLRHLSFPGDWFLSFPGCRSRSLSIFFLPFLKGRFFFPWDRHRSLSLQHFGMSRFLPSLISLRMYKVRVCVRLCVTITMRFIQASQDASPVPWQGDAHPLQLIWCEVATLS